MQYTEMKISEMVTAGIHLITNLTLEATSIRFLFFNYKMSFFKAIQISGCDTTIL